MGASVEETKQLVGREELPALCERLRPCLRRILRRHQIPAEDAEDLVQTALLLAVARWHEIRCPEVWLLGTLQNRCILYWRERRLNEARYVELGEWRPQFAIEPIQDHRDRLADLDRACRTLPAGQRKLLALRYHLGFSPGETARALGLAPGSVRKTANRACELLRRQVRRRGVERAEERIESGPVRVVSWTAAVVPYLYRFPRNTRRLQDGHLRAAVARLGCGTIAEVTVERLQDYRAVVLADGRLWTTQAQALSALRRFLVWAGRRRLHGLTPELIREALGLPRGFTSKPPGAEPLVAPMAGEERPATPALTPEVLWLMTVGAVVLSVLSHASRGPGAARPAAVPRGGRGVPVAQATPEGAHSAWTAAVDRYLSLADYTATTRHAYRGQLLRASEELGRVSVSELRAEDLAAFRERMLMASRGSADQVLRALRAFLLWAAEERLHRLTPEVIRDRLRPPGAAVPTRR